jgi:hypothetical protein
MRFSYQSTWGYIEQASPISGV